MKEPSHKGEILCEHLYEMFRIGKPTETESRLEIAEGWNDWGQEWEGAANGTGFLLGLMKML